ncbi:AAA family ATPase [Desulfatibacillum aliphaticivorans]|uniref:AAA family ATPase n=1 Tax=Desulfatibacillum aliphaticivorans TaxID=218208 RepID=UPI000409F33D|nr:AAA family ATPase [Desulfatibacillum aliphaticivorans]
MAIIDLNLVRPLPVEEYEEEPCIDSIPDREQPSREGETSEKEIMALQKAVLAREKELQEEHFPNPKHENPKSVDFSPLAPEQTDIASILAVEPLPVEAILKYGKDVFLPRGIVGAIMATGGTGKSFFLLQLAMGLARGQGLGPLKPPNPMKVLVLAGEDPEAELHRRLWTIGRGQFPDGLHAFSVAGIVGPLMELQENNPERSQWYYWLDQTIEKHMPLDLAILDPKSRFYGLNENDNDQATQWVSALESLVVKYKGLTILFAHHTSKQNAEKQTQHAGRGASAIVDGIRWAASMTGLEESKAKKYGVGNPKDYVEISVTKSNYAPKPNTEFYWKRGQGGALKYVSLEEIRLDVMARELVGIIIDKGLKLSRRDIEREDNGKALADAIKEKYKTFSRRDDSNSVVNHAIKKGWLEEVKVPTGRTHKLILEPIKNPDLAGQEGGGK